MVKDTLADAMFVAPAVVARLGSELGVALDAVPLFHGVFFAKSCVCSSAGRGAEQLA